jgi:DNA (cytosine-5)-methyltransferase 1
MGAYYNEIDPYAAQWLRNLISAGHIPDGDVDERSIADVQPLDIKNYTQCHFFAGIGGWSHALRLAGWPDDRPIWTGSCPCQPFSVAGKGKGTADERHLWPVFFRLIAECKPSTVFGEQVASKAGREWLSGVFADLEGVGYAAAGADLCAASVGAPHIRQRLYWIALDNSNNSMRETRGGNGLGIVASGPSERSATHSGGMYDMADTESIGRGGRSHDEDEGRREQPSADSCAGSRDVADADIIRPSAQQFGNDRAMDGEGCGEEKAGHTFAICSAACRPDMADADDAGREGRSVYAQCPDEQSAWSRGVEWRRGADGKTRRVKSGVCLLAHGVPARVGKLRAYGNAIVPQVAAEVIKAFMDA